MVVTTPSVLRAAPEARDHATMLLAEDAAAIRVTPEVDLIVGIQDGVVGIGIQDEAGVSLALAESDEPAVREWAVETFDRCWARSS